METNDIKTPNIVMANTDIRIISHLIKVVESFTPKKEKLAEFYFAVMFNEDILLAWGKKNQTTLASNFIELKRQCEAKMILVNGGVMIHDSNVRRGILGVYFVGFQKEKNQKFNEVIETILAHFFFYRHVLNSYDILERIRTIKDYRAWQPYGMISLKFLSEYNSD